MNTEECLKKIEEIVDDYCTSLDDDKWGCDYMEDIVSVIIEYRKGK